MLKRFAQTLALIIVASYLHSNDLMAQTRRTQPRRSRATRQAAANRIQPLTESQKVAISKLIEEAKNLEISYRYGSELTSLFGLGHSAIGFMLEGYKIGEAMPEGNIKRVLLSMATTYNDAGILHDITNRKGTGYKMYTSGDSPDLLPSILERQGLERASSYQAVNYLMNKAGTLRQSLQTMISAAPIIPEPISESITPKSNPTPLPTPTPTPYLTPTPVQTLGPPLLNRLTGTWRLQASTPDNVTHTFIFKVEEENNVYRCFIMERGMKVQLTSCSISGNKFSFQIRNLGVDGQKMNLTFSGEVQGSNINGSIVANIQNGLSVTFPMTGTRQP